MNPVDDFIHDFKLLFPKATITADYEEDTVVFYHNAKISELKESDKSMYEHMNTRLIETGVTHWFIFMED